MEILIFTSPTCIPCRQLKPNMVRIQEREKFQMRVIEASPEAQVEFEQYGVRAVPTVIALTDAGERVGMFVGAQSEAIIESHLRKWRVIA